MGVFAVTRYALSESSVDETMIKKLTKKYDNMGEFNGMISAMVEPNQPLRLDIGSEIEKQPKQPKVPSKPLSYVGGFSLKPQKADNCAYVSPKAVLATLLRISSSDTSELRDKDLDERHEGPSNSNNKLTKVTGYDVYKEFSGHVRPKESTKASSF